MLGSLRVKHCSWVNKLGKAPGRSIADCSWFIEENTVAVRYYTILFQFGFTVYVDDCFGEVIGVFVVRV